MPTHRLQPGHTALLVIDVQEKLLPHMHNADRVLAQAGRLMDGFKALGLPVLVTEQYRKGLGVTVPELATRLAPRPPAQVPGGAEAPEGPGGPGPGDRVPVFEKLKFSACIEPVREELLRQSSRAVVLCGIEAHVCVLQSALDLIDAGYTTAVALDAIGSRRQEDQQAGVMRMVQAGVLPTTVESALLELVHEAGGPRFKAVLPIIR